MSVATTPQLCHPLDGGRRLALLDARREGDEVFADAAILDGKDEPLYRAPIVLTDVYRAMSSATTFVSLMRDQLGERHPGIVAQSGVIVTAIVNWGMAPDETLLGTVAPPLLPQRGDYDTEPVGGVWFEVRRVSAPVRGYLHATVTRLEDGNPRTQVDIVFGNTEAERHAAERLGLDRYSLPALRERVISSFYGPDGPPSIMDDPLDPKDQVIATLTTEVAELRAFKAGTIGLMRAKEMTPTDKVIAFELSIELASAQSRGAIDDEGMTGVSATTVAEKIGLARQTVSKTLDQWDAWGHMPRETPFTGERDKKGNPLRETRLRAPACIADERAPSQVIPDLLIVFSDFKRPASAPKHGGNGNRCPACNGTERKKTVETVLVRTTTIVCATEGCGHIHSQESKPIGEKKTLIQYFEPDDIPTMIDLPQARAQQAATPSMMDTPVRELTSEQSVPTVSVVTPPGESNISRVAWGPVACTDCYAEGRGPLGHIWTCGKCQRRRIAGGDVAAGGGV